MILVDAAPGQGPSLHKHAYAEFFFVIDGEATFTDGMEKPVVRAARPSSSRLTSPTGSSTLGSGRLRQIDVLLSSRLVTEWLDVLS